MSPPQTTLRVFADTNVLYATRLRDILIELAIAGAIELKWSPGVLDELSRALTRSRAGFTQVNALSLIAAMTKALPEALTIPPEGMKAVGASRPGR